MEQLARARIGTWQGGSLWRLQTSRPAGAPPAPTGFHAHHAVQIVISLGGTFTLWSGNSEVSAPCIAVAPDAPHRFDARGDYAIVFVEPESRPGRAIVAEAFRDGVLCELPIARLDRLAPSLEALAQSPWLPADAMADIGCDLVEGLAGEAPGQIDARIRDITLWVAASHGQSANLTAAADRACLSPSRLRHLFVEQTGLSFKAYLLWIRLGHAVRLMTEGRSLTAVSHEAGFADSAHFSRTFRRMFGLAPTNIRLV